MAEKPMKAELNAKTPEILNTVRESIGGDFQEGTPHVLSAGEEMADGVMATSNDSLMSIRAFGQAIMSNVGWQNAFLSELLNRIGLVIISSKSYQNPWANLKRGRLEYGEVIEDIFINICEPYNYDPEVAESQVEKRVKPDVEAMLYRINSQIFYKQTIEQVTLRQAFTSTTGVVNLITGIIDAMYTAMEYDERLAMKYILVQRLLNGTMYKQIIPKNSTSEQLITAVKTVSNLLMTPSRKYNSAGVLNYALKNDQYMFVTSAFDAQSGVEVLAKAFNVDYVQFSGRYIVLDDFSFTPDELDRLDIIFAGEPSYIRPSADQLSKLKEVNIVTVDKDFFMVYDVEQYFDMRRNQQGLYENNFLHVWKVYASGYFANAVMYVETEPTVTSVDVAPSKATMPKGSSLTMKATVTASDFADKTVHWEVSGGGTDVTINEKTGVLTIGNNATAQAYTVKAVSNGDTEKFGSATITVA
jgi:hypothetical protein|nr:MAG TPA: Head protein [Caudoviricetes sp.]